MIKQGEAVFQAVSQVFDLSEGAVPETTRWSDAQKAAVNEAVLGMFLDGTTGHSKKPDEGALRKYIPGLVNNWVRKDPRLNGGSKYQPKRPGSRAGSGDETLKAMRSLLSVTTDPAAKATIEAEIAKRIESLKPKVAIDASKLPESLRHLVG